MSPRQARRERREAERKAKKAELKRLKTEGLNETPVVAQASACVEQTVLPEVCTSLVAQASACVGRTVLSSAIQKRAEINRANAQFSTGPRTQQGKLASSRNSFKHGLASGELIIDGEDPSAFEDLLNDLLDEHQPANPTEDLLINEMAQSWWLTQRAIRLQNLCFAENSVDERRFALFLRYQTTHERAFHKALNTLTRLQKDRKKATREHSDTASGFVSQNPEPLLAGSRENDPPTGFVSQKPPQPGENPTPERQSAAA